MIQVKRVVLDILKPHNPNALEFSGKIAALGEDYRVKLTVLEMDEKTQTLKVVVEADHIDFDGLQEVISALGASLHSIDEVEVVNIADVTH
mgnify:CR=1 FL=1